MTLEVQPCIEDQETEKRKAPTGDLESYKKAFAYL